MPKTKKRPSPETQSSTDTDSGPDDIQTTHKIIKKAKGVAAQKDDLEPSWTISKNRFVKVREFQGQAMVDIREFYFKDGEMLPGKKGISLKPEQWRELCNVMEEVNTALQTK